MRKFKAKLLFIFLFLFLILRSVFWEGIISKALYDFDEARYAEIAKNHIKTNNWLIPVAGGPDDFQDISLYTLQNENSLHPYFWKPPLHTWTIAIFYNLFSISEFTTRLPSLIFALGSLFLIFKISKKLFPKYKLTPFLTIILLSSTSDFSFLSSQGVAEMQLLFLSLLSIYYFLDKKYNLSALFFGLAFLTKSFALFWLPPLLFSYLLLNKIKIRHFFTWLLWVILITLPWHLYMYSKFGSIFINNYFFVNTLGRGTGEQGNIAPIYWYIKYALSYWTPIVILFPLILFRLKKILNKQTIFLIVWSLLIFIPFSLSKSKVWWYIFPFWIPSITLLSLSLENLFKNKKLLFSFILLITLFINFQTYKQSLTRTNFNQGIKNLAQNNPQVTNLSIYKMPYESPLFYFDVGKIYVNFETATDYLLVNKDYINQIDKNNWQEIGSSLGVYLLKKNLRYQHI